jgi:hypothetical protein
MPTIVRPEGTVHYDTIAVIQGMAICRHLHPGRRWARADETLENLEASAMSRNSPPITERK